MPDVSVQIDIPNRALFKAAEVCDIVQLQAYVLRSWEAEFPDLGVTKSAGAARVYRRSDVEQVARIKHLLLVEGLTLAGARRKLEEEASPALADDTTIDELMGRNARERLTAVKRGLVSILDLLSGGNGAAPAPLRAASTQPSAKSGSKPRAAAAPAPAPRKAAPSKSAARAKSSRPAPARRKRA
jgi:DNA-binding transcriptional MerR regulator